MSQNSRSELSHLFGENLEFDKDLARFTTFKTGGPARLFLAAKTVEEIASAISTARKIDLPYFLLGGGSNILMSDAGYNGLIIKVNTKGIESFDNHRVVCAAGENLQSLVDFTAENGLTGLEFAAGIFGSVGGAIYGNAGAFGGEISDVTVLITLVDRMGLVKKVEPSYCRFGYRDSYLKKSGEIVAEVEFQLAPGDKNEIRKKIDDILMLRSEKHPVEESSAGSFFKNIPDKSQPYGKLPAGKLLEEAGAKGMSVGGAKVFAKHANIIINDGTATSKQISDLADKMKEKVMTRFNIELEEEVIRVGDF